MKAIRYLSDARGELDEAIAVYEEQREGRGARFREAVEKALGNIQANPAAYAKYKRTQFRECVVRRFPYAVCFLELDDAILIVAVAHGKRRQGYWLKRVRNLRPKP